MVANILKTIIKVALLTIGFQGVKTAAANPVDSLRDE